MFTSNFARLKLIAPPLEPVAISIGLPRFGTYKGRRELRLAPTRAMLQMSSADYDEHFEAQLAALGPGAVAADLGDNAVMLCWEPPGFRCHRRRVAEWFEKAMGIEVPELGFARNLLPPYAESPWKGAPVEDLPWTVNCDHCQHIHCVPLGQPSLICRRCHKRSVIEW